MRVIAILTIVVLTFAATLLSACVPRPVHSREELRNHQLGYPITFISQDLSGYDPETFPVDFRFNPPWEHGFSLNVERFLASWAMIFAVVAGCVYSIVWMARRVSKHAT